MKNGYYIGDFEPSAFKTKNFEVAYVKHKQNDKWVKHYHKIITEINISRTFNFWTAYNVLLYLSFQVTSLRHYLIH